MIFPSTGIWTVKHGRPFEADVVATRNMDFSRRTFAMLAKKAVSIWNETTDANFNTLMAIVPISDGSTTTYYFITIDDAFSWDGGTGDLTALTNTNIPSLSTNSDGVSFGGVAHVSGDTNVKSYAGGSWTDRITSGITSAKPHPLSVDTAQNALAVGNGNTVKLYDSSYSLITTLTLPSEYLVTSLRYRAGNHYIGTRHITGAAAKLFVWDGSGTAAQSAWDTHAEWIYSVADAYSSIVVVTSAGQLLRFNGGGFDELAHFPIYETPFSWHSNASLQGTIGRIANRGMVAAGDELFINIDGTITDTGEGQHLASQPSGLWVYTPGVGLYHRAGGIATRRVSSTPTFASSLFTVSAAHNLITGDPVRFTNIGSLSGVATGQTYHAIVDGATTLYLARTKADALAGKRMTITGTAGAAAIIYDAFDMMGAAHTTTFPGAVSLFVGDEPADIIGSRILFGAEVTKSDGSSISSLMSLGASHNVGSFTLSPVAAAAVTDIFNKLFGFFDNVYLAAAQIVVKYRYLPRYGFPSRYRSVTAGRATWVSATQFTVDASGKDIQEAAVGDEVDIIEGAGAGYTAHITAILPPEGTSTTYTITIDETIPGITAAMVSEVMVDNWIKRGVVTAASKNMGKQFAEFSLTGDSPLIELKFELRGIDIGVRRVVVATGTNKTA